MTVNEATTTGSERDDLVGELLEARRVLDEASTLLDRSGDDDAVELSRYEEAAKRLEEAERRYEAWLPRPALSRCPLTGAVFRRAIDTGGLDGPWWDADRPVRPVQPAFPTFFAFGGAVDVGETPPSTPFLVLPGPGIPWVCPRLLRLPGVRAVVSRIFVGTHSAYPVVYFCENPYPGVPRINDWGAQDHTLPGIHGEPVTGTVYPVTSDYDFELGPWIASGRVLWVAPGDPELELHSSVDDCPYIDLPGRRKPVMLRRGIVKSILSEPDDRTGEAS